MEKQKFCLNSGRFSPTPFRHRLTMSDRTPDGFKVKLETKAKDIARLVPLVEQEALPPFQLPPNLAYARDPREASNDTDLVGVAHASVAHGDPNGIAVQRRDGPIKGPEGVDDAEKNRKS